MCIRGRAFGGAVLVAAASLLALGASQPAGPLPDSELSLVLLGVAMDSAARAKSFCLVRCAYPGEKQTTTVLLGTGERACGVAEIAEIRQYSVVIKNLVSGRLELLTFPATGLLGPVTRVTPSAPPEPVAAVPSVAHSPNLVTIEISRDSMNHYLRNLPELLTSAVASPYYRDVGNGQSVIDGFEINGVRKAGAADQLGLQNGDVILEVNGNKLDSAASVVKLLGLAQGMSDAKVIVLRNGERVTLIVDVK
jgi:type II secretory pathway component PulC